MGAPRWNSGQGPGWINDEGDDDSLARRPRPDSCHSASLSEAPRPLAAAGPGPGPGCRSSCLGGTVTQAASGSESLVIASEHCLLPGRSVMHHDHSTPSRLAPM
eukprot:939819-Rhodomonas_salina.1